MTSDNNAYALINEGYAHFISEDYDEAIRCYDKAIEIDRNDVDAWTWIEIGNRLFDLGKYNEAMKYYDKAVKRDRNNAWAWRNKGLALYSLGRYDEAVQCYDRALQIDRDFVDAWIDMGNAVLSLGEYDEAIKCYGRAIESDPNYVDAWTSKGNALFDLGEYDEAITCYDKAIELDRNNAWAWGYKGHALGRLGNHDEAFKHHKKAIGYSTKATKLDPNSPSLWIVRGSSLQAIGDYFKAEKCYNKAVELDPYNIGALGRLGSLYADYMYDHDKAIKVSRRILEINPNYLAKANIAEDLVGIGSYEEGRTFALEILSETQDTVYQCVARFLILASYLLEGETTKGSEEFAKFLDYYSILNKDFKIEEGQWVFRGLVNAISKSNTKLETKFVLLTLIDLIQGKIDRRRLSFLRAF